MNENDKDSRVLSRRIKHLMELQGLTTKELANRLDMKYINFWRRLKGERVFDPDLLSKVAEELGTSVAYLIGETDNPNKGTDASLIVENSVKQHTYMGDATGQDIDYLYWVGVIDEVRNVLERGNENEISSVAQCFRVAYDMLSSVYYGLKQQNVLPRTFISDSSVYGGHHNRNGMTVKANS